MRSQKIFSVFMLALFFIPAALLGLTGGWQGLVIPGAVDFADGFAAHLLEESFSDVFAGRDLLCAATSALQTALGRNQQNGYFYSPDGILHNLPDADERITAQNLQALQTFAGAQSAPCYFLLSPTSAAIEQSKIPNLALESLFNQKQYIQRCYASLSSRFRTIDGYNSLFSHQSEYLFYHTDARLTAQGCYYLYVGAGEKLGYTARSMDYFSISHPLHNYKGNLSELVPYAPVEPDLISLFHYQKNARGLHLVQDPLGEAVETQLYDLTLLDSNDPLQIYLGPDSGVTDILADDPIYDGQLLVFTDGSCDALFPLIAIHYRQLRVVNLHAVTSAQLSQIDPAQFDQVLFAFSVEQFGYDSCVSDMLGTP
ncbi:MAG: DHHW family protein [Oscillospiraceae bacterium]|nr:DHHW family protein [Oscillospiraceae bacterium]